MTYMSVDYMQRLAQQLYVCNKALEHGELDDKERARIKAEVVTIKAKQRGE